VKIVSKVPLTVGLSALAAGSVFALGLPWFLLPVALTVFFWVTLSSEKTLSLKRSILLTGLFFWLFYATVLSWFLDTDISLLAGLENGQGPLVLGFCFIVMTTLMTIVSLPLGATLYVLQSRLKRPDAIGLIALASVWVLIEWLRSLVFSAFLSAPEASIGDYWNFGSLGMGIISTPLGYSSRIVGMYGLSILVVALGLTVYWASKKSYKPLVIVILIAASCSVLSYLLSPTMTTESYEARLLQGDSQFSGQEESAPIRNMSAAQKDLIILPEYSRMYDTENIDFTEKFVTNQLSDDGLVLDVTADFTNPEPRYSYLIARDKERVVDTQTKRLLIPTGEYLPNIVKFLFTIGSQTEIIDDFARSRKLEKGEHPHIVATKKFKIAPVACSGILGRNIYRQLVNDGGEVLTNSASLATFAGSKSYFRQSMQMAKFHAIANNRTFIQATIGAPGFVIDNNGRFILEPDGINTEFADFSFTPNNEKTFYTRHGDWPLMLSVVFMVGFSTHLLITKYRKSSK
jgi:apolipoprotein N-acyltransferase